MKNLRMTACIVLALGTLAFTLPALAQEKEPPPPATAAVTTYDKWDDHLVPGDLVVSDGTFISGKGKKKPPPTLIKVRTHFIPEMLKSVQKL